MLLTRSVAKVAADVSCLLLLTFAENSFLKQFFLNVQVTFKNNVVALNDHYSKNIIFSSEAMEHDVIVLTFSVLHYNFSWPVHKYP